MTRVLVDPVRGTVHDRVPTVQDQFPVSPPLRWVTLPPSLEDKDVRWNEGSGQFEEIVPPPPPPVVIDPTPDTLDVVQMFIDAGIITRAQVDALRPDWGPMLDNNEPGHPVGKDAG